MLFLNKYAIRAHKSLVKKIKGHQIIVKENSPTDGKNWKNLTWIQKPCFFDII